MNGIALFRWWRNDRTTNHCPVCARHSGQVKPAAEWSVVGTPPLHPHCGCRLVFAGWREIAEPDGPPTEHAVPLAPPGLDGAYNSMDPAPDGPEPDPPPWTPTDAWPKGQGQI